MQPVHHVGAFVISRERVVQTFECFADGVVFVQKRAPYDLGGVGCEYQLNVDLLNAVVDRLGPLPGCTECGAAMDINKLSPEAQDLLERASVQPEQLQKIAGQDGIITGRVEAKDLYSLVEDFDENGTMRSLETGHRTSDGTEAIKRAITGAHPFVQRLGHISSRRTTSDAVHWGQIVTCHVINETSLSAHSR